MFFNWLIGLLSKLFLWTGLIKSKNAFAKPLSGKEEDELFDRLSNGDKEAEELLIKHNLRLVAFVAKKYKNFSDQDELISVGSIGLLKAVKTFKKEKGRSFSTYASRCIENEILMLFRGQKKYNQEISIDESIGTDKDGNSISLIDILSEDCEETVLSKVENKMLMERVNATIARCLTEREKEVVNLRFGVGGEVSHTQREVAAILKISRSYVSRIENEAIEKIKNNLS